MEFNLRTRIISRREEIYDFYYRGIGDKIRRTRLELNMTQETLAKGICSNTYISKIENNKIAVNKEHLFLLMEKMGIPTDKIGFPEKMVDSLEKAIEYFYFKDLDAYEKLFQDLEQYEFGILIYVVRLGYYVLTEDYDNAKTIYDDMYRYLNSLEDYGFATFLIFGGFYNCGINDFQTARMILESVKDKLRNDEILFSLYSYLEFLVYGNLHLFNQSRDGLEMSKSVIFNYGNCRRVTESMVYTNIFRLYEKQKKERIIFHKEQLTHLSLSMSNYYLIMLAFSSRDPNKYLQYLNPDGRYYLTGLFFLARHHYINNEMEQYAALQDIINDKHYSLKSKIDYGNLLKLSENQEDIYYRDYLINRILPYLIENQNIFFHDMVTRKLQRIFSVSKRYKEAQKYGDLHKEFVREIQVDKRITI